MRVFGVSSCIRLRARRKVDFPQPLGPIIAVTALERMLRLTLSIARFCPYQIDTFFASKVNFGAGSLLAGGWAAPSTRSVTLCSGVAIIKLSIFESSKQPTRRGRGSQILPVH